MAIRVNTKPYGEIEIDENQVIEFPDGIFGFENIRKFILLDSKEDKSPFMWLQAYDEPNLAFIVIRPADFMESYSLNVSQSDISRIMTEKIEDILVLSIVTIPANPAEMTANLQGPIIINTDKRVGKQAISLNDSYTVRHSILGEIKKKNAKEG